MYLTESEFKFFIAIEPSNWPAIAPAIKLLLVRDNNLGSSIEEVLIYREDLRTELLGGTVIANGELAQKIDQILKQVYTGSGSETFPCKSYSPGDFPSQLQGFVEEAEVFQAEFEKTQVQLKSDRRQLTRLIGDEFDKQFARTVWSIEAFAAFSLGYRPRLRSNQLDFDSAGPVLREINRRTALMIEANSLPPNHPDHIALSDSPQRFIDWAIKGSRFSIVSGFLDLTKQPTYEELIQQVLLKQEEIDRLVRSKANSGLLQEKRSLQKICTVLLGLVGSRAPVIEQGRKPSLYDPDAEESRFIGDIRKRLDLMFESEDLPSDGTFRKYFKEGFQNLSVFAKEDWRKRIAN